MPKQTEPRTLWAKRVRDRRHELRLSQTEAARLARIPQPTLSDVETGRILRPNDRIKVAIAAALECDPIELFPFDEVPEVAS